MKDLILLFNQLLAQHAWIKYALEITLLTLGAGVVRVVTLRLFKRWTLHLNWKHKHFLVALVERMITPILAIAVVSAGFNFFPLGRWLWCYETNSVHGWGFCKDSGRALLNS
jgi:hypothetical protein